MCRVPLDLTEALLERVRLMGTRSGVNVTELLNVAHDEAHNYSHEDDLLRFLEGLCREAAAPATVAT